MNVVFRPPFAQAEAKSEASVAAFQSELAKSRRALVLAVAIQVRGYWSFTLLSVPVLAAPVLAVPGQTECNWQLLPLLVLTGSPFSQVRGKRPPGLWTVAGSRVVGH